MNPLLVVIEDTPANIGTCERCQPYWNPAIAELIFDRASHMLSPDDRLQFTEDWTRAFLTETLRAARTSGCACAFWEHFAREFTRHVLDLEAEGETHIPSFIRMAVRVSGEREDWRLLLQHLAAHSVRRGVVARLSIEWVGKEAIRDGPNTEQVPASTKPTRT